MRNAHTGGLRALLLLGALGAGWGCGQPPTLLLVVDGVSPMAANLKVTVKLGAKAGVATFARTSTGAYVADGSGSLPNEMSAGATTVKLAVDLPADATGTVSVNVTEKTPGMTGGGGGQMQPLVTAGVACADVQATSGSVTVQNLTLMTASASCAAVD